MKIFEEKWSTYLKLIEWGHLLFIDESSLKLLGKNHELLREVDTYSNTLSEKFFTENGKLKLSIVQPRKQPLPQP